MEGLTAPEIQEQEHKERSEAPTSEAIIGGMQGIAPKPDKEETAQKPQPKPQPKTSSGGISSAGISNIRGETP